MTNQRLFKILDIFSYILLLINVFSIPLILDKNLVDLYIIPKEYLFIGLILLNLLAFAIKVVISKRLLYRRSILDVAILGLLALFLLSSFFSINIYDSFLGRGDYFILHFIFFLSMAIFYFVLVNYVNRFNLWQGVLDVLLLTGGLTAILFCLKIVFHYDLLSSWFGIVAWNPIDKINSSFGLWSVVIFILSAGQLIKRDLSLGRSLANFFIAIISLTAVVLLGFKALWWLLLIGLILLLLLGVNFLKEARTGWLSVLFATLIFTVILVTFGTPKQLASVVPAEVALGNRPSWNIAGSVILSSVKNFLLGSGPGTFNVDFSQFRTENFNYDNNAWNLRFGQPFSSLQAFVAESGLLFTVLLIFIILYVLGHVFQVCYHSRSHGMMASLGTGFNHRDSVRLEVFLSAVAWMVLSVGVCFIFFGSVLWWLWWLLLGLIVTGLSFLHKQLVTEHEWVMEDTPQYSLSFSFILIVVIAAVIMAGVWGVKLYSGELLYAQALQSKDYKVAEAKLVRATELQPNVASYHAALAQVYLLEALDAAKLSKPDVGVVSTLVAKAVNEAKLATEKSPGTVAIWENLAIMYENAASLVPDAREWAIKTWQQALKLEPTNAVLYWRLANNYGAKESWDEAIKNYRQAISLKKDYVGSYIGLARVYDQTKQSDKAIETYQGILGLAANNQEVLFNYGLLLYNRNKRGDRDEAEKLWLEAVRLAPNYSNALYSLGLLHEIRGEKSEALQYYYKVKDLNPENKDITTKIRILVGGK